MTEVPSTPPARPGEDEEKEWWEQVGGILWKLVLFFWDIVATVALTIRALFFLIVRTPTALIPSVAMTSSADNKYNEELAKRLKDLVEDLELDETQKEVITENWLGQVTWTNSRATRERDANELIRWWQVILGVLIPALIAMDTRIVEVPTTVIAGWAGIFVAVITAIAQFRRAEERWRHYRIINERYLDEFWNFITLSRSIYNRKALKQDEEFDESAITHQMAFPVFNDRMSTIRREDVAKFFGEVVPSSEEHEQVDYEAILKQAKEQ
jgi:hypothetical protein